MGSSQVEIEQYDSRSSCRSLSTPLLMLEGLTREAPRLSTGSEIVNHENPQRRVNVREDQGGSSSWSWMRRL